MAITQAGTVRITGEGGSVTAAFPAADIVGWTYTRQESNIKTVEVQGCITTKIWNEADQRAELQLNVIFGGVDSAAARASAAMPITGRKVPTSSFPVIADGQWSDALNSATDWQFKGGSITGTVGDAYTGTITLERVYKSGGFAMPA